MTTMLSPLQEERHLLIQTHQEIAQTLVVKNSALVRLRQLLAQLDCLLPHLQGKEKEGYKLRTEQSLIPESRGHDQGVRWVQIRWIFPHMPPCQDQRSLVSDIIHPPYLGCSARGHFLFCSQEHEEHHMSPRIAILS